MDSIITWLIAKTWKSDYFRSWILAQARHVATAAGTALVAHGLANNEISQDIIGLVVALTSFYLAAVDVKVVDGKIQVALDTPVPGQSVQITQTATSNDMTGNTLTTVKVETKPLGDIPK